MSQPGCCKKRNIVLNPRPFTLLTMDYWTKTTLVEDQLRSTIVCQSDTKAAIQVMTSLAIPLDTKYLTKEFIELLPPPCSDVQRSKCWSCKALDRINLHNACSCRPSQSDFTQLLRPNVPSQTVDHQFLIARDGYPVLLLPCIEVMGSTLLCL